MSYAEPVAPVELQVRACKKDGRVPGGAEVEYAYRAGYDSRGRLSVTHLVDERGYGVMLNRREPGAT